MQSPFYFPLIPTYKQLPLLMITKLTCVEIAHINILLVTLLLYSCTPCEVFIETISMFIIFIIACYQLLFKTSSYKHLLTTHTFSTIYSSVFTEVLLYV